MAAAADSPQYMTTITSPRRSQKRLLCSLSFIGMTKGSIAYQKHNISTYLNWFGLDVGHRHTQIMKIPVAGQYDVRDKFTRSTSSLPSSPTSSAHTIG
eukprot:scaffold85386_cov38-Cyclotella_meneghiniana.AAC.4